MSTSTIPAAAPLNFMRDILRTEAAQEPAPVATGSPAAGPAGMPPKAKAKGAAAKAKAEAAAAGKAKARAETITTMKSPWRPLASLLKAICSVPYITSHPASEAV